MSRAPLILLCLVIGLLSGVAIAGISPVAAGYAVAIGQPLGTLWLNALQMTVVPLVVSLLVTGVAATAQAARAGRIAARAIILFVATVTATGTMAALAGPLLLDLFPVPQAAAAALRAALTDAASVAPPPPLGEFIASIVPTNVISAAANNAFLSLIVFTLAFAFAITRLDEAPRARLIDFFTAIRDAMLILIEWVLRLAPVGVFALALVVGARAGTAAFGALAHYVLIVSAIGVLVMLMAYALALVGGRIGIVRFARALAPAQAVAISTQSSLASLPAMLQGARRLGIAESTAGMVLPLAVAILRGTQPAMNIGIAVYIAHWFGIAITPGALASAVFVGVLVSLGSVSLPAQITFYASIAPVCQALGVPIAPLGLLIAIETFPDIFRTLGNVSMDLAATATVSHLSGTTDHEGHP
ncbi:dicarboxylate/amino acid:cation symporter [Sphingomonas carotinifaciens]|uniref:dicarboxylate/amino acid:cation symporter n=1 Tax=Sphingomonas carotinifaciens TaxID=1166323 RepID=UPI000DDAF97F|nr:cation:dicarboxylase symporter family transporter [Sphingomonas carotinifaciens]